MKNKSGIFIFLSFALLIFSGCKKDMTDFTFVYTIEKESSYKIECVFNNDQTYTISQYKYLSGDVGKEEKPTVTNGVMTETESEMLKTLIQGCDFFNLNDTYKKGVSTDVLYRTYLVVGDKEKTVLLSGEDPVNVSFYFDQLFANVNSFISLKTKEEVSL